MVNTKQTDRNTGKLVSIEVRNFKSYRGEQNVGPFKPFTAVVGPNGSGKSNLMDAICFVLGEKTQTLRGSLKELLYSSSCGDSEDDAPLNGSVGIRLTGQDNSEVLFERIIQSRGGNDGGAVTFSSQYKVDGVSVTHEQYNSRLMELGILVQAKNFLIPQGQVENVASKDPKQLTQMFEEISGSGALKQRYEELEQALEEKSTLHSNALQARRHIRTDKNQKKQQKVIAEKHMQIKSELEQVQIQYYLWKAFSVQEQVDQYGEEVVQMEEAVNEFQMEQNNIKEQLRTKQQEIGTVRKHKHKIDEQIRRQNSEIDRNSPTLMRVKADIKQLKKRFERQQKELQSKSNRQRQHEEAVQKLQSQIHKAVQDIQELEQEVRSQQRQWGTIQLDDQQMEEYEQLKNQVGVMTARLVQERDVIRESRATYESELAQVRQQLDQCDEKIKNAQNQLQRQEEQREPLVHQLEQLKQELVQKQEERETLVCGNRKQSTVRQQLQRNVDKYEYQLREASYKRKESEIDQQKSDAVAKMKEMFPGRVYGRILDLLKISQKKYNLAISIAMESHMESVVVDNNETAKQCINFLREFCYNRKYKLVMTFIPLQTIKAKDLNEQFRELGGSVQLAMDLIEFEGHLQKAFLFVLGNTLICDTLGEARQLAFSRGGRRVKVVTLDGSKIDKCGTMSGGTDDRMHQKAARLDSQGEKDARQKLQRAQEELSKLGSEREGQQQVQQLTSEIQQLQNNIRMYEMDLTTAEKRIATFQQKIEQYIATKQQAEPLIQQLEQQIEMLSNREGGLSNQINEISDNAYANFSARVGVDNIREYEERRVQIAEGAMQRKLELNGAKSKLEQELQFEMRNDYQEAMQKLQNDMANTEARLQQLQEQEDNMEEAAQGVQGSIEEKKEQVEQLSQQISQLEVDVKKLKNDDRNLSEQLYRASGSLSKLKAKIDVLQSQLRGVAEEAQMHNVALPTTGSVDMDIDNMDSQQQQSQQQSTFDTSFDFAVLDEKYKRTHQNRERTDDKFRQEIDKLQKNLERHQASAHALEQYEAVVEREERQQQELDQITHEKQLAEQQFNEVKEQRANLFTEAFEHVKDRIDEVYKDLTRSQYHPMGGSAYLNLEDEDNPFQAGIRFSVMPPSKRYREMEQLSGGEKTLAALALIFAIHSFRPSPFFVMDEIDASLDQINVTRIANYIRQKTQAQQLQCIVISLKDTFFSHADLLVGVARLKDQCCSNVFHFDLSRFKA